MIISANPIPELNEFNSLLHSTVFTLNGQTKSSIETINDLSGVKLEQYAADIMKEHAIGTPFENTIECTRGQSFPDIVAKKFYGVEVKTTIKNHWKTTGNSVLETSRLPGVERIFILFGKLADPVEFKYRPYEECLSDVVVTHSPRYLIDMNLSPNQTIFDKMDIPYDDLRKRTNPIREITNYYKGKLKKGDELWWLDQTEQPASNMIIRIWSNLSENERKQIIAKAFIYFPELLGNSNGKFSRLAMWLITKQGIVCPSLRDTFSAGGKVDIITPYKTYRRLPRVMSKLSLNINEIRTIINNTPAEELTGYWGFKTSELRKTNDWTRLILEQAQKLKETNQDVINEFIRRLM